MQVFVVEVVECGGGGTRVKEVELWHVAIYSIKSADTANCSILKYTMGEIILSKLYIVFECVVEVHGFGLVASDWCGAVCVHSLLPRNTEVPVPSNHHKFIVWKGTM